MLYILTSTRSVLTFSHGLRASRGENQLYLRVPCMIRFSGEQPKERRITKQQQGRNEKVSLSTPTLEE
jgi:hypothetical protein